MSIKNKIKIYIFGDSICFGQLVSPHKIWVAQISKKIESEFKDRAEFVIQNPSINGNTTRMALERMPLDVQSHAPDVVHIQFGMNDCNLWASDYGHPRTSEVAFVANLNEIIERSRRVGAKKILLGVNHPTTRTHTIMAHSNVTYDQQNRKYNNLIRQVGKAQGIQIIDHEKAFDRHVLAGNAKLSELLLEDELHLSLLGHQLYTKTYMPHIRKAILDII